MRRLFFVGLAAMVTLLSPVHGQFKTSHPFAVYGNGNLLLGGSDGVITIDSSVQKALIWGPQHNISSAGASSGNIAIFGSSHTVKGTIGGLSETYIWGGGNCLVDDCVDGGMVPGISLSMVACTESFMAGGNQNSMTNGTRCTIIGGGVNWIGGPSSLDSTIFAGQKTIVSNSSLCISIGPTNQILNGSGRFTIGMNLTNVVNETIDLGLTNGTKTVLSRRGITHTGAEAHTPVVVTLTADNQTVETYGRRYIQLTSDTASAGLRTFNLRGGTTENFTGQLLEIEFTHASNTADIVDDAACATSGNQRMNGSMTFTANDVLVLRFNGTDWVERGRSVN